MFENPLVFKKSLRALRFLEYLFILERATVVIPCFNEEKTVGKVVERCRESPLIGEVVVVDDGSSDGSARAAKLAGARVVRHRKNRGKGVAILSGARAAKNSVLVFIDADFENVSADAVEKLALPLLKNEAYFAKATFEREGGRVTELTAKPLLEFIFPEVSLSQPLSGQFAIRKEFLQRLDVTADWGIDIGLVLDSVRLGERILEVNIGEIVHKHRSLLEVAQTAREVAKTILQKAGFLAKKHKLIIFDFDKTLVAQSSISLLAGRLGFEKQLQKARRDFFSGKISERDLTRRIGKMFAGQSVSEVDKMAAKIRKNQFADETLVYLKRMGYKVAVVSFAFRRVINAAFKPGTFDAMICPVLKTEHGLFTGQVDIPAYYSKESAFCKGKAARALMRRLDAKRDETIAVGDADSDDKMFEQVGVPVVIGPRKRGSARFRIKSLPEVIVIAS